MAGKAFDEEGNLRPGFEHLDPRMIDVLKDVHEREKLKAEGAELIRDSKEVGADPEVLEQRAYDFGFGSSDDAVYATVKEAEGTDIQETLVNADIDSKSQASLGGFSMSEMK